MATVARDIAKTEEARVKVIFQGIIFIVFLVCTTYTLVFNCRYVLFRKDSSDEDRWHRQLIFAINNASLSITTIVCLIYSIRYGAQTRLKAGFIIMLLCWSTVAFVNGTDAEIFRFTTLALDCCLFFGTLRDAVVMDGMALLVLVWFMVAVTLDHIAWSTDGAFNVHFWDLNYCHPEFSAMIHSWLTHILPTVVNFVVVRSYVRSVRKGELLALRSVELAYIVADKLANYALDDAEMCLTSSDVLHDASADIRKPLSRVLDNLKSYKAFLPNALFEKRRGSVVRRLSLDTESDKDILPNSVLCSAMSGKEVSLHHVESAVNRLRDHDYTLEFFHKDMIAAFPELELYTHSDSKNGDKISSGRSGMEEYKRTLGALYAVYSLLRLDIDGKEVFSFGVDDRGKPRLEPVGVEAGKKQCFYEKMPWHTAAALLRRAGLLKLGDNAKNELRKDRVAAMLALTAIHDIMKNTALLPFVHPRHAPYKGYTSNERIHDHDVALGYILEHFPTLLPSFKALEPGQRAPVFFTQGKMDFNNGWFVQGEAPPGALFSRFKEVIMEGRAAKSDISFYFVHWLTDLAGAEVFSGGAWPGAEKFTVKFPVKVLSEFLESFGFIDRLAIASEVAVMEDYLESRWRNLGLSDTVPLHMDIAAMRLALMAQGFESELVRSLGQLSREDCTILSEELAKTGCKEQFRHAPISLQSDPCGPALLIYYSPALLQKAGGESCAAALRILASVFRAARNLFPLDEWQVEMTVTIRIDEMKVLSPAQIASDAPWYLRRTSGVDAEAVRGTPPDGNGALIDIEAAPGAQSDSPRWPKATERGAQLDDNEMRTKVTMACETRPADLSGPPQVMQIAALHTNDSIQIPLTSEPEDMVPDSLCCAFGCTCTQPRNKEHRQFKHVLCV